MNKQPANYALITGASSGIGKHIAIELASRNINVLLIALHENKLSQVAAHILEEYKVLVDFVRIDLSKKEGPRKVYEWTRNKNYRVNMLINNAGHAGTAIFDLSEEKYIDDRIMVNIRALVLLSRYFIPDMKKLDEAYIMNVGSLSAWYSIPFKSIYAASKAFVLSFSRALHTELQNTCISVSVVNPNGVKTNPGTFERIKAHGMKGHYTTIPVEKVAEISIDRMLKKKFMIIPGFLNRMILGISYFTPKSLQQRFLYREFSREITSGVPKKIT